MKEGKGENTSTLKKIHSHFYRLPSSAKKKTSCDLNREREDCRNKAEAENLTIKEANRLGGQAMSVTLGDICTCINVSAHLLQLFSSTCIRIMLFVLLFKLSYVNYKKRHVLDKSIAFRSK